MSFIDWVMLDKVAELNNNLKLVAQLNKLLKIDPKLTANIVDTRYPVSKEYEDSEFVYMDEGTGLIGVLSGLVLDTNNYRISANYDDNNVLIGFSLLRNVNDKFILV